MPPMTMTQNSAMPGRTARWPVTIAALANFRRTRPVASFTRLSPSRIVTIRRGRRTRRAIAVAATASGGETMAPRTRAAGHGTPGTRATTTAATAAVVATTRPTARSVIEKRFARKSRHDVKYPAA